MTCIHCGGGPVIVGGACLSCSTPCPEPGCANPADPAEVGGLCPQHVPADNTLEVEGPGENRWEPDFTVEP